MKSKYIGAAGVDAKVSKCCGSGMHAEDDIPFFICDYCGERETPTDPEEATVAEGLPTVEDYEELRQKHAEAVKAFKQITSIANREMERTGNLGMLEIINIASEHACGS